MLWASDRVFSIGSRREVSLLRALASTHRLGLFVMFQQTPLAFADVTAALRSLILFLTYVILPLLWRRYYATLHVYSRLESSSRHSKLSRLMHHFRLARLAKLPWCCRNRIGCTKLM